MWRSQASLRSFYKQNDRICVTTVTHNDMEHLLEGNNTLNAYCIRATTASQNEQRLIVNHNLVRKDFKWVINFGMETLNGGLKPATILFMVVRNNRKDCFG